MRWWPRPPSAPPRPRSTSSTTWPTPSATAATRASGAGRWRPATCPSGTRSCWAPCPPPSAWPLLVCSLGAVGVAIAKRYTELTNLGAEAIKHRPVMHWYRPPALRLSQIVVGALMIAAYLAWAAGEHPGARTWHLVSAVPLAAALIRFGFLTGRRTSAPVEDMLTRDAPMLACELSWLALFVAGL